MTTKRSIVRVAIIAAIIVSAIWIALIVVGLVVRVPFQAVSDLAAVLAAVGGIMGAIFAVGGLIVALVAVLTQLQLQDRVTQVLAQARRELEDKFDNELQPRLEAQGQLQIEGTLSFFQATIAGDWKAAESYTREALLKYPKLSGARSFLALRLSRDVESAFYSQLAYGSSGPPTSTVELFEYYNHLAIGSPGYYSATVPSVVPSAIAVGEPPKVEALDWLNEALEHGDNPNGDVSAALVLMYAVSGAYDRMLGALQTTLKDVPTSRDYLLTTVRLNMLAYGCSNSAIRMQQVGTLLSYPLPISQEQVVATLRAEDWRRTEYMDWYAVESNKRVGVSAYPGRVRVFRPKDGATGEEWFAYFFPHDGMQQTIPTPVAGKSGQMQTPPNTLEELVGTLCKQCHFICPSLSWPPSSVD